MGSGVVALAVLLGLAAQKEGDRCGTWADPACGFRLQCIEKVCSYVEGVSGSQCDRTNRCKPPYVCGGNGVCTDRLEEAGTAPSAGDEGGCKRNDDCDIGFSCLDGECAVTGGLYRSRCNRRYRCGEGLECREGVCRFGMNTRGEWEVCDNDSECIEGLKCIESFCSTPGRPRFLPWVRGKPVDVNADALPVLPSSFAADFQACVDQKATKSRTLCFDKLAKATGFSARHARPTRGAWKLKVDRSEMDDSATVLLSVDSPDEMTGTWGRGVKPTLILRCSEGQTDAYVVTGLSQNVEYGNVDGATVDVRFDKTEAFEVNTSESTSGVGFFFPEPESFMRRATQHDEMLFRFTPYRSSPQTVRFPLGGLEAQLPRLAETCRWGPPPRTLDRPWEP